MARESTIQIYNSILGTTSPNDLSQGELAFAGGSDKLFVGKGGGATAWIGALIETNSDDPFGVPGNASDDTLATSKAIQAFVEEQVISASSSGVASVEGITGAVDVVTSNGVAHTANEATRELTIYGVTASNSTVGVAKFNSDDFSVDPASGDVTFTNRYIYIYADNYEEGPGYTLALGASLDFTGNPTQGTIVQALKGSETDMEITFSVYSASTGGQKGVASFLSGDFSVNDGAVELGDTVVRGIQTNSGSVVPVNNIFGLSGGTAAVISGSGATATIGVKQATTTQLGVASFDSTYFSVGNTGHVTLSLDGGDIVTSVTGDTATGTRASRSGDEITIRGITASDTQMGTAKFDNGDFSVNQGSGTVTLANSGSGAVLAINATTKETTVSRSNGTVTVGLPDDVLIAGGLTVGENLDVGGNVVVTGNLTVNGTTTTVNTNTLDVEDPLIYLASNNDSNSVDIGFVGRYNSGGTKYTGLVRDATDSGKYKLFAGTSVAPGNTSISNFGTNATLVANINAGTF